MLGIQHLAVVAVGGSMGALARHLIAWGAIRTGIEDPRWATLAANVLGCIAIGWILEAWLGTRPSDDPVRLLIVTGVLGSLTTFSTFGYETWHHLSAGRLTTAGIWICAHLVLGLVGVWIGATIGTALTHTG